MEVYIGRGPLGPRLSLAFSCFHLFSLVNTCVLLSFPVFTFSYFFSSFLLSLVFSFFSFFSFSFFLFSLFFSFFLVCRYLPTQNHMFPRSSRRFVKYMNIFRKS